MLKVLRSNSVPMLAMLISLLAIGISVYSNHRLRQNVYNATWHCPTGWTAEADGCHDGEGSIWTANAARGGAILDDRADRYRKMAILHAVDDGWTGARDEDGFPIASEEAKKAAARCNSHANPLYVEKYGKCP